MYVCKYVTRLRSVKRVLGRWNWKIQPVLCCYTNFYASSSGKLGIVLSQYPISIVAIGTTTTTIFISFELEDAIIDLDIVSFLCYEMFRWSRQCATRSDTRSVIFFFQAILAHFECYGREDAGPSKQSRNALPPPSQTKWLPSFD